MSMHQKWSGPSCLHTSDRARLKGQNPQSRTLSASPGGRNSPDMLPVVKFMNYGYTLCRPRSANVRVCCLPRIPKLRFLCSQSMCAGNQTSLTM